MSSGRVIVALRLLDRDRVRFGFVRNAPLVSCVRSTVATQFGYFLDGSGIQRGLPVGQPVPAMAATKRIDQSAALWAALGLDGLLRRERGSGPSVLLMVWSATSVASLIGPSDEAIGCPLFSAAAVISLAPSTNDRTKPAASSGTMELP